METINYKLCVGSLYLNIHSTSSQQLSSRGALYKTLQYKIENTEDTFPPQHLAIEGSKNSVLTETYPAEPRAVWLGLRGKRREKLQRTRRVDRGEDDTFKVEESDIASNYIMIIQICANSISDDERKNVLNSFIDLCRQQHLEVNKASK